MDDQQVRPLPDFPKYLIANNGVIYVKATGKPRRTYVGNSGYETINLLRPPSVPGTGKYISKMVHRLVAKAFLGYSELVVNHKDGNKLNNQVNNLEYATRSENMRHAIESGLSQCIGVNHHFAKLTEPEVREICELLVSSNLMYKQIAAKFNISRQAVQNIASKHRWSKVSDNYWLGKLQRLGASRRV